MQLKKLYKVPILVLFPLEWGMSDCLRYLTLSKNKLNLKRFSFWSASTAADSYRKFVIDALKFELIIWHANIVVIY